MLLRVFAWSQTIVLFNDGPVYLALSEAIASGHFSEALAHPYHPLYPMSIALVSALGFENETAAVAVSVFGGLLSIGGLFLFLDRAFDRETAWMGAWILALHPWAIDFSSDVMSDSLYAGFYLTSLACLACFFATWRSSAACVCGLFIGLAYGVRPEGIGLLAVAGLVFLGALWDRRGSIDSSLPDRWTLAKALLFISLTACCVALPYVATVSQQAGEFTVSAKKSITALARGEGDPAAALGEGTWSRAQPADAKIWLPQSSVPVSGTGTSPPSRDLAGVFDAVWRVTRTSLSAFRHELALFAVMGCLVAARKRIGTETKWPARIIWASLVLNSGLLVLLVWGAGYVSRRHALAASIPAIGFAAIGWRLFFQRFQSMVSARRRSAGRGRLAGVESRMPLIALIVLLVVCWGGRDLRVRRQDRMAVREAAEWLAASHPGSGPVAAQKLRTAYYANAAYVPLASGLDGPLRKQIENGGAAWIVIDESRLGDHLGLEEALGGWLAIVQRVEAEGRTALILSVQSRKRTGRE